MRKFFNRHAEMSHNRLHHQLRISWTVKRQAQQAEASLNSARMRALHWIGPLEEWVSSEIALMTHSPRVSDSLISAQHDVLEPFRERIKVRRCFTVRLLWRFLSRGQQKPVCCIFSYHMDETRTIMDNEQEEGALFGVTQIVDINF